MKKVILASQSLQRQALLDALHIKFETMSCDIDELAINHPDHLVRAAMVAKAKAEVAQTQFPSDVIITADTFVVLNGHRLEKPLDLAEAKTMLQKMSGQSMEVYTGWVYWDASKKININQTTVSSITFRTLTRHEIDTYIGNYPVTKWAGAFSLSNQEGLSFIASLQGSLTSVLGLPVEELVPLLEHSGLLS